MNSAIRAMFWALTVLGTILAPAGADDLLQKAVSDPGAFWGVWGGAKAKFIATDDLKGGAAQRVTITPKPARPWDAGTYAPINKPVKKGDTLVLMFYARAEKPPEGSDLIMVTGRIYEAGPAGSGVSPETNFIIGQQWKLYYSSGTAMKDYPPGSLSAGMVLGTGEQVIDFGPVAVLDMGPNYNLTNLPHS